MYKSAFLIILSSRQGAMNEKEDGAQMSTVSDTAIVSDLDREENGSSNSEVCLLCHLSYYTTITLYYTLKVTKQLEKFG